MRILLLAVLLLLPQFGAAQIYKSTDEHGNISFSDTPSQSGPSETVELQQTNSTPAPQAAQPQADSPASAPAETPEVSYSAAVASPENETTIPMGPGNIAVSATVEPALEDGALLQLYVDGSPSGNLQSSSNWQLTNVFRGAHDLSVAVIDTKGNQLTESDSVRVYVLRPSVNFRK